MTKQDKIWRRMARLDRQSSRVALEARRVRDDQRALGMFVGDRWS